MREAQANSMAIHTRSPRVPTSCTATTLGDTGAHEDAQALLRRALAIQEQALGPDHPDLALTLVNLAIIHLEEKRAHDALPLLERAEKIYSSHEGVQPGELETQFRLAKALVATGGDRARAIVEARKARDGFREGGMGLAEDLADVEQWLTDHESALVAASADGNRLSVDASKVREGHGDSVAATATEAEQWQTEHRHGP